MDTALTGSAYSPTPAKGMSGAVTRARFYQRTTVPTGTNGKMNLRFQAGAGTGEVKIGAIGFYNATRLGI